MNIINVSESKQIQLDILSAVDRFCRNNNIIYSVVYGTLLGAVRHKGFIPWDDDIDICMLRSDYDRFVNEFPEIYDNHYRIATITRTPNWHAPFTKVYDDRTIVIQRKAKTAEIGINIDVFPFDDVPEDIIEWKKYWKKQKYLLKLKNLKAIKIIPKRSIVKNIILVILKIIFKYKSQKKIVKEIVVNAQKYNKLGYKKIYPTVSGITKVPIPKTIFDEIVDYEFENRIFKGFKDYDCFLRNTYGNYMQLPPESERIGKHDVMAFWK